MKLAVAASGALGLKCLQQLPSTVKLVCVFTDSGSVAIIEWCDQNNIPVFKGNPRKGKASSFVKNFNIDVLFSINYLFIIEQDMIGWPSGFAFNIHGSLLPKYRGRTPHVWAIINDEKETGFTVHIIDENCDTGDIVYQESFAIKEEMTGSDVLILFNEKYPAAINKVLAMANENTLQRISQDESKASWYGKRTQEDGLIDWNKTSREVYNWVRAQAKPYPGAFSFYNGHKITIHKISFSTDSIATQTTGTIINIRDQKPVIKTKDGAVQLEDFETAAPVHFIKGEGFYA